MGFVRCIKGYKDERDKKGDKWKKVIVLVGIIFMRLFILGKIRLLLLEYNIVEELKFR